MVKPSDTRWLSNKPALIVTLQQLYKLSGDAEAYGLSLLLSSFWDSQCDSVVRSTCSPCQDELLYAEKVTDLREETTIYVKKIHSQILSLKEDKSEWCSQL